MDGFQRDKLYRDRLLTHFAETRERKFYAIRRLDLLVISISGAGIYSGFEMLKFIGVEIAPLAISGIKMAGFLFIFAIVLNLLSQWSGYYANDLEEKSTEFDFDDLKNVDVDAILVRERKGRQFEIDRKVKYWNLITNHLNGWSTGLMFLGMLVLFAVNLISP